MMDYDEKQVVIEITPTNLFKEAFSERDELLRLKKISQAIEKIVDVLPFDDKYELILQEKELLRFLFYSRVLIPDQIDMVIDSLFTRFSQNYVFLENCWSCLEYFSELPSGGDYSSASGTSTIINDLKSAFKPAEYSHKQLSLKTLDIACGYLFKRWSLEIVLSIFDTIVKDAMFLNRTDPLIFFMQLIKSSEEQDILQDVCIALDKIRLKFSFLWDHKEIDEKIQELFMSKSGKYCRVPELLRLESDGNLGGSEEKLDNNNLNESPSNRFPETINQSQSVQVIMNNSYAGSVSRQRILSDDDLEEIPQVLAQELLQQQQQNLQQSQQSAQKNQIPPSNPFAKHLEKWLFDTSKVQTEKLMIQKSTYIMEALHSYENVQVLLSFIINPRIHPVSARWVKKYPWLEQDFNHPVQTSPEFRTGLKDLYDGNITLMNSYSLRSYKTTKPEENIYANMEHVGELLQFYIAQNYEDSLNLMIEYNILFNIMPFVDVQAILVVLQGIFCVGSRGSFGIPSVEIFEKYWLYAKHTQFFIDLSELMVTCRKTSIDLFKCDNIYKTPDIVELLRSIQKVDVSKLNFSFSKFNMFWPEDDQGFRKDIDKIRIYKQKYLASKFKKILSSQKKDNFSQLIFNQVLPMLKKNKDEASLLQKKNSENYEEDTNNNIISSNSNKIRKVSAPTPIIGRQVTPQNIIQPQFETSKKKAPSAILATPSTSSKYLPSSPIYQIQELTNSHYPQTHRGSGSMPMLPSNASLGELPKNTGKPQSPYDRILLGSNNFETMGEQQSFHRQMSSLNNSSNITFPSQNLVNLPNNPQSKTPIVSGKNNNKSENLNTANAPTRQQSLSTPRSRIQVESTKPTKNINIINRNSSSTLFNSKLIDFETSESAKHEILAKINLLYPLSLKQIEQCTTESSKTTPLTTSQLLKNDRFSYNIVSLFFNLFQIIVEQELLFRNENFYNFARIDYSNIVQSLFQKQIISDISENYFNKAQLISLRMFSSAHKSLQLLNYILENAECRILNEVVDTVMGIFEKQFVRIQKILINSYGWMPQWWERKQEETIEKQNVDFLNEQEDLLDNSQFKGILGESSIGETKNRNQIHFYSQNHQFSHLFRVDILKNLRLFLELLPKPRQLIWLQNLYESTWSAIFELIKQHPYSCVLLKEAFSILTLGTKNLDSNGLVKIWIQMNALDFFQCQYDRHITTAPSCQSRMDSLILYIKRIVVTLSEQIAVRKEELSKFNMHLSSLKSWQDLRRMVLHVSDIDAVSISDSPKHRNSIFNVKAMQGIQGQRQQAVITSVRPISTQRERNNSKTSVISNNFYYSNPTANTLRPSQMSSHKIIIDTSRQNQQLIVQTRLNRQFSTHKIPLDKEKRNVNRETSQQSQLKEAELPLIPQNPKDQQQLKILSTSQTPTKIDNASDPKQLAQNITILNNKSYGKNNTSLNDKLSGILQGSHQTSSSNNLKFNLLDKQMKKDSSNQVLLGKQLVIQKLGKFKEGNKQGVADIIVGKGDEGNSSRGISPFKEKNQRVPYGLKKLRSQSEKK